MSWSTYHDFDIWWKVETTADPLSEAVSMPRANLIFQFLVLMLRNIVGDVHCNSGMTLLVYCHREHLQAGAQTIKSFRGQER